ncbi:MAG: hypothetical protein J0L60_04075 [Ignavibacteria bacterium]|nr:hypothetical protein [Ignavibacteria bacterium]MCA0386988.1 hypothetical protein [Bacteroidota bacterium]
MKFEEVKCKDVMLHICENLKEDINSEKCRAIREHIEKCDACKDYCASVECTIDWYREYNPDFTDELHRNLLSKLGLE